MPVGAKVGDAYVEVTPQLARNGTIALERQLKGSIDLTANRLGTDLGKGIARASQGLLNDVGKNLQTAFGTAGTKAGQDFATNFNRASSSAGKGGGFGGGLFANATAASAKFFSDFGTRIGIASFQLQMFGQSLTKVFTLPVIAGGGAFAKAGLEFATNIDKATAGLKAMLPVGYDVEALVKRLNQLAVDSAAFNADDVVTYTQKLTAAGNSISDTEKLMKALSNIFGTFGVTGEQAGLAMLGVSQIFQKGKVQGEELTKQISQQIPIWKLLAEGMGVTQQKLTEMVANGEVSAEEFSAAMQKIGNTKQFVDGASNSLNTLGGAWQVFKEKMNVTIGTGFLENKEAILTALHNLEATLTPLIEYLVSKLPEAINWVAQMSAKIREMAEAFNQLTDEQKERILKIVAALAALGPALIALSKVGTIASFTSQIAAMALQLASMGPLGLGLLAVAAGIAAIGTAAALAYTQSEPFRKQINEGFKDAKDFWVNEMIPALQDLKKAVDELIASLGLGDDSLGFLGHQIMAQVKFDLEALKVVIEGLTIVTKAWTDAINFLKDAWKTFTDIASNDTWYGKFIDTPTEALEKWKMFFNDLKTLWNNVWGEIKTISGKFWSEIVSMFTTDLKLDGIVTAFQKVWDGVLAAAKKVWEEIKGLFNFGELIPDIPGGGLLDKIQGLFGGGGAKGGSLGKSVLGQFSEEFGAGSQGIVQQVQTMVTNAMLELDKLPAYLGTTFTTAIGTALGTAIGSVVKFGTDLAPVLTAIMTAFDGLTTHLSTIFKPAWDGLFLALQIPVTAFKTFMDTLFGPGVGFQLMFNNFMLFLNTIFKVAWDTFLAAVMLSFTTFQTNFQNGWNLITTFLNTVVLIAFQTFKTALQTVWTGILATFTTFKDSLIAALNSMVDGALAAINKLIGILDSAIDKVNKVLPKSLKIAKIGQVTGGAGGRPADGRQKFKEGGKIGGTGSGTGDRVPIMASRGEYMIREAAANKIGVGALNYLNRYGTLPADGPFGMYAGGGPIQAIIAAAATSGIPHSVGSTFRSAPQPGMGADFHMSGMAVDFPGFGQDKFAEWWLQRGSALLELIHRSHRDYTVKRGQSPYNYGEATMAAHANHVHVASSHPSATEILSGSPVSGGANMAGPGMGNGVNWMGMLAEQALRGVLDKLWKPALPKPDGLGLTAVGGIMADKAEGMIDYIISTLPIAKTSGGSGVGGAVGSQKWRGMVVDVLNELGQDPGLADKVLASIEQESGGNPNAVQHGYVDVNTASGDLAKGLNQVIGATFRSAVAGTPYEGSTQFDPRANIYASIRYAMNRYGSAWADVMAKPGGYDNGGILSDGEMSMFNASGKPEMVLNTAQGQALLRNIEESGSASATTNGNGDITVEVYLDGVKQLVDVKIRENNLKLANALERGRKN
jgi:tape measure domain-containing protein